MTERERRSHHSNHFGQKLAHSIADVTKLTGVGRSFIYEAIKTGDLKMRKAGRRSLIFDADLTAWLASLPSVNSKITKSNNS